MLLFDPTLKHICFAPHLSNSSFLRNSYWKLLMPFWENFLKIQIYSYFGFKSSLRDTKEMALL